MGAPTTIPLLLVLLIPPLALPCPVEWFSCEKGKPDSGPRPCGQDRIKCNNSILYIQFSQRGKWYPTDGLMYPERTLTVRDESLVEHLQDRTCSFLYSFTHPIEAFDPSVLTTLSPTSPMFDCKPETYDFSADLFQRKYHSSYCGDYDLYHSSISSDFGVGGGNCSVDKNTVPAVEWKLSFQDDDLGVVRFNLLSVGFSLHRKVLPECFGCNLSAGRCGSVNPSKFHSTCNSTCHHNCPLHGKSQRVKIIIGSVAAAGLLFCILSGICLFFCCRKYKSNKSVNSPFLSALVRSFSSDPSVVSKDTEYQSKYHFTHIFSCQELEDATDGFHSSKEIGDGGFGTVYKGNLRDGRVVAVKRLYENNYKRMEQFMNEILILGKIRHPNLVALYGCTSRQCRELLLVYEYVPNGTVADHLHGEKANPREFTWHVRMNAAVETASALAYLHSTEPQIIHRDIKTHNILLDDDFHVKVADFGLSRLFPLDVTHVSTAPQGTPGYVDPEYYQCYQLTDKSDVYSFGVVLVELISSKPAVDITRKRSEINLSSMAINKIRDGLLHELADPELGFEIDPETTRMIRSVAELAFLCLQAEKDLRPSMEDVKAELMKIADGGRRKDIFVDIDRQTKEDLHLLHHSAPFSPDSVTMQWNSRTTTPHASG